MQSFGRCKGLGIIFLKSMGGGGGGGGTNILAVDISSLFDSITELDIRKCVVEK